MEHQEGASGVGPSKEYAMEVEVGSGRLDEVLSRGDKGDVVFWGRDLGVVGANSTED